MYQCNPVVCSAKVFLTTKISELQADNSKEQKRVDVNNSPVNI